MKNLLRKLFFWDASAKGAFFGLTLMVILPRLLLTLGYVVILPLFLRGMTLRSMSLNGLMGMAVIVIVALLYALVMFGHVFPKLRLDRVLVIAITLCAVLMLGYWGFAPSRYKHLWWIFPVALIVFSVIYTSYPIVKIQDWLLALVPLILGGVALYRTSVMQNQTLIATVFKALSFDNIHAGEVNSAWLMWSLTIVGILLLALSYLLWGRIIAKMGDVSFRSLFGRGVVILWSIFVACYLTSAAMALYAMMDYRLARKELDHFWKMPVNSQTIEEQYKAGGQIDQNFWNELTNLNVNFSALNKQYDGIDAVVGFPNAVLPPDVYGQWRKAFEESPELLRGEAMLDEPPPLPERHFVYDTPEMKMKTLSKCRTMARLELWRVRLALESKDILSAQKALLRFDNVSLPLQYDYSLITGLVWIAIENMRASVLSKILGSGLADEQWLREQDALLQEKENCIASVHERMIKGEAAYMLSIFDILLAHTGRSEFLTIPEAWLFLGREGAALVRSYCISDFSDYPEKPAGILAGMLSPSLRIVGTKKIPELIATLRISRSMIAAELARKRNGRYPDSLDDLPTDPFSGQPLKYAITKVEISEEQFQPNEDPTPFSITPEAQRQLGMTDEQLAEFARPRKYTFRTERRTVDAVQIWSVGKNGIDDSNLKSTTKENDYGDKRTDDIRFIIPIP